MKKILVPTDFSACATYASDVAVAIARRLGAEVQFYSRIAVHPFWQELTEKEKMDFPESFAELYDMKTRFAELTARYQDSGVKFSSQYSAGNMLSVVQRHIDDEDIDLVVMGSHGAHGAKAFMFGSNAQKLVRHAHCPVMVIKTPLKEPTFGQVVFASDFREEAFEPFQRLLALTRPFHSHLHLLSIRPYPSYQSPRPDIQKSMERFQAMAKGQSCTLHHYDDKNVEKGITHFALELKADLVAVSHYGKSPFHRIFSGSVTEALANHLSVPVLSLNPQTLREDGNHNESMEQ